MKVERHGQLAEKLTQDSNRRLKSMTFECSKFKDELIIERKAHSEALRGIAALQHQLSSLTTTESTLREDCSRSFSVCNCFTTDVLLLLVIC